MTRKQIEIYLGKEVQAEIEIEGMPLTITGTLIKEKNTYSILTKNPYNLVMNTLMEGFYAKDFKKIEVVK